MGRNRRNRKTLIMWMRKRGREGGREEGAREYGEDE
jgi:hypothetical protein